MRLRDHALTSGTRRFSSYPEYRDSGVEWLGEIPARWSVSPIRALASPGYKTFVDGDWIESPYIRDEGIRLIQTGNIGTGIYREQGFRYIDEETFNDFRCTEVVSDDVLICRLAEPVGRACLAPDLGIRMITSVDVCILKPSRSVDPRFVVYALSGREYLAWLEAICRGGTRDRVSRSMLGSIRLQKPPLGEQRAIADFLDRETATIDALVTKKERLIELLQEKRAALITRAVTKGLDPTVPMKDSGVRWLGQIPAHWRVTKAGFFFSATSGATPGKERLGYWDGDIPWVTPKDMKRDFLDSSEDTISERALREVGLKLVQPSAILIVVRGMILAHTFPVAIATVPVTINQDMKALKIVEEADPHFFALWLRGVGQAILADLVGEAAHGTKAIRMDAWRSFPVVVPPLPEQHAITSDLERQITKIDALIAKMREGTDSLMEYRTALISAAVTGKIDVLAEVPAGSSGDG